MPYLIYQAESNLTVHEIVKKLELIVGQPNWLGIPPKGPFLFFGNITLTGFKIMRVIRGRDSFNPLLYGKFIPSNSGTHVKVVMTFHPFVWLFMICWSFFHGYWMFVSFRDTHQINSFGSLWFMLFLWLMAVPLFYYNAAKSKKLLRESLVLSDLE